MAEYNQIRAEINHWSLESDDRLFRKIELFAQNFLNKVDYLTADTKNIDFAINSNQVELINSFSKFLNLANHKFTENKMQPLSDADLLRKSNIENDLPPMTMDTNSNIVERYQQALNFGMDKVNIAQYLNQTNDDDDRLSVSDAGERSYSIYSENSVLPGKNNKLPYIIGTRAFLEDDYVGIYENPEPVFKPEVLNFQEISLPDSNIKVETNYIPKIEQPPPPQPNILNESQNDDNSQNNNNPPPPPLLISNGVTVNQNAPPPPPLLLLPGIKPAGAPLTNNPPPLPPLNNSSPPFQNSQAQMSNNNPITQAPNGSKIIAPPPINLLIQNQNKPAANFNHPPPINPSGNQMIAQQNIPQQQMFNPMQSFPQQNQEPENKEPLDIKSQLEKMFNRNKPPPPQPEEQMIGGQNTNNFGQPPMGMGMGMVQPGTNMMPQPNMNMNMMNQSGNFGQPGMNPNVQPGMNMMMNQSNQNPPQMGYPNLSGGLNPQNYTAAQNQNYAYRLSESQIPQIDVQHPFNPNQNFYPYPPQNYQPQYQNYQPQPQNFPPQNMNQSATPQPTINTASNVNVNKKAPPPPSLPQLLQKEKDSKNNSPVKIKPNQNPSVHSNQNFVQPQQQLPPQQMIPGNPQPQMSNPSNVQEELMARLMNKNKANQAGAGQATMNQPKQLPSNSDPNFRYNQPENISPIIGNQAVSQAFTGGPQINQPFMGNPQISQPYGQNEQKLTDAENVSQQQNTLIVPGMGRPSLKPSKSVDIEKLEGLYKSKKPQGNSLFDDDDGGGKKSGSDEENDGIFKQNRQRKKTNFDDIFKPAINPIIESEQEKIKEQPLPKKEAKIEKPLIVEPENKDNQFAQFNAKKMEDGFIVSKKNDIFEDSENLIQKAKVPDINNKKGNNISKLFENDSDDEDISKKTTNMKELYGSEVNKLKRSKTTIPPSKNEKALSLFKDNESDDENQSKNVTKPILKEKKQEEKEENNFLGVQRSIEKKPSVRFSEVEKEKPKPNPKAGALFNDDEDYYKPIKKEEFKQKSPEVKKPERIEEPPVKKTLGFLEDSSEITDNSTKDIFAKQNKPKQTQNNDSLRPSKTPLNFLEESNESLAMPKTKPSIDEDKKDMPQKTNIFGGDEKPKKDLFFDNPLGNNKKDQPLKKPLDFDEPSESLGFNKGFDNKPSNKPLNFEGSSEPLGFNKTQNNTTNQASDPLSNERPSKKPFNFDEPSESLGFNKTTSNAMKQEVTTNERPSKKPFNFDEPSESLGFNKTTSNALKQEPAKKPFNFDEPSESLGFNKAPSNTAKKEVTSNDTSKKPFNFDEPSESLGFNKTASNTMKQEDKPVKKPFNFDEPSESLGFNKTNTVKQEPPKKTLNFDEPSESLGFNKTSNIKANETIKKPLTFENSSESLQFNKPKEDPLKKNFNNEENKTSVITEKKSFPPKENLDDKAPKKTTMFHQTSKDQPKQEEDMPLKKPAKTVTSKIQGLQDKLGNLPIGGMFQRPEDRMMKRPPKKDNDKGPELDHDLLLEKPTMLKKKKPRGAKNAEFNESEADKNLLFERKNNAIIQQPEELTNNENDNNLEDQPFRMSKPKSNILEEEKKSEFIDAARFSSQKTQPAPMNRQLPTFDDSEIKKQTKKPIENSEEFAIRNQQSLTKPPLPSFNDSGIKKPTKKLLDDSDEVGFNPLGKPTKAQPKKDTKKLLMDDDDSQELFKPPSTQKTLPKLPDLSEKQESKIENKSKINVGTTNLESSIDNSKQLPTLPDISGDKKKKKNPLEGGSKHPKKKDIFEDDAPYRTSKNTKDMPPALPSNSKLESKTSSGLPDFKAPSYIAKPGEKESKKLKKLFDDDEDDNSGFLFKPKTDNRTTFGNNTGGGVGKKKNLFDD